jgi:hypothetical protein
MPVDTYILRFSREGGVYKRYFWASASSETCTPGKSYVVYSVFLGVMLACPMHSLESLFFLTCNSFTSFSDLIYYLTMTNRGWARMGDLPGHGQ